MHAQPTKPESPRVTPGRQSIQDLLLRRRLDQALQQSPYRQVRCVELDVADGCVVLRGFVASFFLKQHAQTAAMRVAGIDSLENRLEVRSHQ